MPFRNGIYYNAAYTYEEAKTYLNEYKEAQRALVSGQVKAYTIGSRSVTLLDIDAIDAMINKFAAIVAKYESGSRPARNVAVVPRDT